MTGWRIGYIIAHPHWSRHEIHQRKYGLLPPRRPASGGHRGAAAARRNRSPIYRRLRRRFCMRQSASTHRQAFGAKNRGHLLFVMNIKATALIAPPLRQVLREASRCKIPAARSALPARAMCACLHGQRGSLNEAFDRISRFLFEFFSFANLHKSAA